jgi:Zn-dependent alcohol dehydrogenase
MTTSTQKKHPCPDCRQCQHCSDSRCSLCRGQRPSKFAGMSMAEQIAMFEMISRGESPKACSCRSKPPLPK